MHRFVSVLLAALAVLALGVVPAAAHINHISVDDQVTDDGTILVETTYVTEGSSWHVVVHAHNGTGPGESIGHRTIDPGPKNGFTVSIDDDHWREFGENTTVWVALHRDDGDGSFDSEPIFVDQFDRRRAQRIAVGKRDAGRVNVVAHGFSGSQTVNTSAITVPHVSLAEAGAVELYAVGENGSFGPRVGRTELDAGVSENVTVQVEESFFAEQGDRFKLWAAAAHGGTPVRVGDERVASRFGVKKGAGVEGSDGGDLGTSLGTPTEAATTETATSSPESGSPATERTATRSSGADGPGLGVLAALVALLAVLARRGARN